MRVNTMRFDEEEYELGIVEQVSHGMAVVTIISIGKSIVISIPVDLIKQIEPHIIVAIDTENKNFITK